MAFSVARFSRLGVTHFYNPSQSRVLGSYYDQSRISPVAQPILQMNHKRQFCGKSAAYLLGCASVYKGATEFWWGNDFVSFLWGACGVSLMVYGLNGKKEEGSELG